ncbi:MAG: PAS domain-containing protein, partial [Planctomycetota bacterium]
IFWIAPDAKFIYVNDAACRTLGYSKQELLKMTVHDIDPNYNPKNWPEHWKNLKRKGSAIIESQHRTKNGNLIPVEIIANYLKFGEKEYNCAFARDMSEHKRSGLALRMSEQRFRAIADYTYFWEVWVSPKGCVLWTNPAVERITGYSIEQLKQMTDYPMPLVHEDDRETIAEAFESALTGSSGKALEFRLRRKDGSVIWADISWQPIYDEKGSSQGHRESIRDITERKRAEEEVRKSQQMLQSVLDTIPVGVFWKDRESVYLGCNQHFAKDASLNSPDEIIGKNDYELGWKEQTESYRADDAYVIQTGKPKLSYEEPVIASDGTQLWVRTNKVPLRDLNGNVIGILGTYEDISEQKRAEQAIRANERRFRSVVETASDAIITADSSGEITFWNSAAEDMFGYSADEIIGKPLTAIIPKRYHEAHLKGLSRLVATGQPRLGGKIAEFEALKKDGSEFPISLSIANWGVEEGMFFTAIIRDITKRKQAEEALLESEQRFRDFFENAPIGFHIFGPDQIIIDINDTELEMIGYTRDEIVGRKTWAELIIPQQKDMFKKHWHNISTKGHVRNLEYTLVHKEGHLVDVLLSASSRFDEDGCLINTRGSVLNITDRKQAEEALRGSEMKSRTLLEGSPVCNKIIDLDSRLRYMSAAGIKCLKIPDIKPYYGTVYPLQFYPESAQAPLTEHLERAKAGEISSVEAPAIDMEGSEVWFHTTFVPACDDQGRIEYIIASSVNITERKRADELIRVSEANYRAIFESANDAIFIHDIEKGEILDFNPKMSEIFGYTRAEAKDFTVDDLSSGKPGYTQKDALEWIRKASDGTPQVFEWQCRHKSGRLFRAEVSLKRARISGQDRMLAI